jgi:hypothetical protein
MTDKTLKRIALRPSEVKATFGIPEGTLANLRWAKKGPRYFRKPGGRAIFYLLSDLETWLTSEPVQPRVSIEAGHERA